MSRLISVRDLQEMVRNGQGISIPDDALVTPSARDFLSELETTGSAKVTSAGNGSASTKRLSDIPPPLELRRSPWP